MRVEQDRMFVKLAAGLEMEFCRVAAGAFKMGGDPEKGPQAYSDEQPVHTVQLSEYWLGRYPVTNRQYAAFVSATKHALPEHWSWGKIPAGKEEHPVVRVSWQDATEFCAWLKQASGESIRLPSEAEWEKAARGTDGRIYPWGSQPPDVSRANYDQKVMDTTLVGKYSPAGDSPYGCADMAGNVWEWVSDWYKAYPGGEPNEEYGEKYRVVRGGSWDYDEGPLRSSNRSWFAPSLRYGLLGFRCAR